MEYERHAQLYREPYPELVMYFDHVRRDMSRPMAAAVFMKLSSQTLVPMELDQHEVLTRVVASDDIYMVNPSLARDIETVMPLAVIGPQVEALCPDIERVGDWIETMASEMIKAGAERHSAACLDDAESHDYQCQQSALCPWLYLQAYLGQCASSQDFQSDDYQADAARANLLVLIKLKTGAKVGVLSDDYVDKQLDLYRQRLDDLANEPSS